MLLPQIASNIDYFWLSGNTQIGMYINRKISLNLPKINKCEDILTGIKVHYTVGNKVVIYTKKLEKPGIVSCWDNKLGLKNVVSLDW